MIWGWPLFLVLGSLLLAQSAVALVDGLRFRRYACRSLHRLPGGYTPFAAVLIPCKGIDAGFEQHLASFAGQDYPRYQLIFIVATRDDPAYGRLKARADEAQTSGAAGRPQIALVVAGYADDRGEKVHNLLRGLEVVDRAAEVLVFADLDARPGRDWLRSLVAALAEPAVTVSTGFRWYLPGPGFASRLRAAWDTSLATFLGEHNHNFAWGGSMAIRAADFKRLGIAERHWTHTVSDDYALTRAVREAGGHIRFEPRCLLASGDPATRDALGDFFRWANRQIILTRVYAPHLWRLGLAAHGFYCLTMGWGIILLVFPRLPLAARALTAALLLAVLLLGAGKGMIRTQVARQLFPEDRATLAQHGSCYWQLTPLVPWVMLANFLVAGFVRRIEWRGTHYRLVSADRVRVLRRGPV